MFRPPGLVGNAEFLSNYLLFGGLGSLGLLLVEKRQGWWIFAAVAAAMLFGTPLLAQDNRPQRKKAAKEEKAASGGSAREKLDAYYNREPRRVEQDPNDPLVSCRLHGKTQFMRKSHCTLRGGSTSA